MAWPDDFGTRFTLFVDTEEEFDWTAPFDSASRSTSAMAALPDGHKRLCEGGGAPVYLIDHPVATAPAAIDALREVVANGGAVGTQLHPWVNPPIQEAICATNSFPGNLPEQLEAAKLDTLTDEIARAFGTAPRIYRAGRYGIGPATARLLADRGYRIDSSMRSRYDYGGHGGPDFRAVGNHAFWLDRRAGLAELPLTTVFTGRVRAGGERLYRFLGEIPRGRGLFARTGMMARVAMTPEDMPLDDALEAIRVALGEGVRVLNFSFHSPSLTPGFTPYVRDAADLKAFYGWWDAVFALLARRNVQAASQSDLIVALDRIRA
ncbi:polysaccharide deacetylase family protein [Stakelama sp. CBK3Z-3]|uniref:Polysaccharide deacetylase family protein n=1 Tax=Stakelama flava TaxID=2860338 RepID=A0ABS6XKX0_9SPHN|nr:polysaccharide deacetylase family protein [Stakelama flava]